MTEQMYRYQTRAHRSWVGDYSTELKGMEIELLRYPVQKETPKGVWVFDPYVYKRRWISLSSRKAFAYSTYTAAMNSFKIRNAKHIGHLERSLKEAKLAKEALAEPDLYKSASTFHERMRQRSKEPRNVGQR